MSVDIIYKVLNIKWYDIHNEYKTYFVNSFGKKIAGIVD